MNKPPVYFKKRERFEKYMAALAAGNPDGRLAPEEAVKAHYEFMRLWNEFTLNQKIRMKKMRYLDQTARGRGEELPVHDYAIMHQDDVQFWRDAFENARERV